MAESYGGSVYKNSGNRLDTVGRRKRKPVYGGNDTFARFLADAAKGTNVNPFAGSQKFLADGGGPLEDTYQLQSVTGANDPPTGPDGPATGTNWTGNQEITAWANPGTGIRKWMESQGYATGADDPFTNYMSQLVSGFPFLWDLMGIGPDASSEGGEGGAVGFIDYLGSLATSLLGPANTNLSGSGLFNLGEMGGVLNALITGDPNALTSMPGYGGNSVTSSQFLNKLRDPNNAAAFEDFLKLIASMGATAMTPGSLEGLLYNLTDNFQRFTEDSQWSPSPDGASTDSVFWRWLMSNGRSLIDGIF